MAKDWKQLKAEIDAENKRILDDSPEDVVRVFKYEILRSGGGTGGLMMGPWIEGATAGRYVGAYYVYNILKLAGLSEYSAKEVKAMLHLLLPKVVSTAKICGLETLARFSNETMEMVKGMEDKEELLLLLNSLYLYGSNMNAWIHHYMKWGVGLAFPIPTREDLRAMGARADLSYQ